MKLEVAKKLTIKYIDKSGNKIKDDEIEIINGDNYKVEVPKIEGYLNTENEITGKILEDTTITLEYYKECIDLAFTGINSSGNVVTDESQIVAYTVSGIGSTTATEITIPRKYNGKPVTQISEEAFKGSNITLVNIGDNIENVGVNAFRECYYLNTAYVDANKIQKNVFNRCTNIDNVVIGKNVSTCSTAIFLGCSNLKKLTILSEKIDIHNDIIGYNTNLKEVKVDDNNSKFKSVDGILYSKNGTILYVYPEGIESETYNLPSDLKEIGTYAFAYNDNIKVINIPDTIEKVGEYAFRRCTGIKNVNVNAKEIKRLAFYQCYNIENVTIGNTVSTWADQIFSGCNNLSNLVINSNNLEISNDHLATSTKLKEIKLNESNPKYKTIDGVVYSKDGTIIYAYPTGKEDETYQIQSTVKEIGANAFAYNAYLKNINIPSTVQFVGQKAFYSCTGLTDVNMNSAKFARQIFWKCSNLANVTIGSNVLEFSDSIFSDCKFLTKIKYLDEVSKWNSIKKDKNWNKGVTALTQVVCSDGTIDV